MKIRLASLVVAALVVTSTNAFALAGELKEPGVAFSQGYPEAARQQVMAALNRPDCKFLKGNFISWHTSLLYAGETKALNLFLDDLAKCPGVTLHVSFATDPIPGQPCDWVVAHDAHSNRFHFRVNLKSERVKLPELYLPEVKGPAVKTVAALTRELLAGEWGMDCLAFKLTADGAGAWLIKGPAGPLAEPEPFKWELSGSTVLLREATGEKKLEVVRKEDESLRLRLPSGSLAWRLEQPTKKADASPAALAAPAKRLPITFDIMARDAVLVVHCRAEVVTNRTLGKVLDVWKGTYAPPDFERQPPTGFVDVNLGVPKPGDQAGLREGAEFIVLWHRLNQVGGGLRQFYLVPVKDGKVSQEIHRSGLREELTVAELKQRVSHAPAKPGK